MAQLMAIILLLSHVCSCFPLLPWGQVMGSNATFSSQKCSLPTLSQRHFCGKLVWHKIYYHTTTTEPIHWNSEKHICKKPSIKKPSASTIMPTDHKFSLYSPAQSGNLEYGEDFSILVNLTMKDIFPPPRVMEPPPSPAPLRLSRTQNTSPQWLQKDWQPLRRNWQVKP
jgi:hypothetical protein